MMMTMTIPHTALSVFGEEHHFFGRSSSSQDSRFFGSLLGMDPIQRKRLGVTKKVSQSTFEHWCHKKEASLKYNGHTYHCWHRNGHHTHFSQEDADRYGLKLLRISTCTSSPTTEVGGILAPTWIVLQVPPPPTALPSSSSLPHKLHVVSSPMMNLDPTRTMMMVRPMLLAQQRPQHPSMIKALPSSPWTLRRPVNPVTRPRGAFYVSDRCPYNNSTTKPWDPSSSTDSMDAIKAPTHPKGRLITLPTTTTTTTTTFGRTSRSLLKKYTQPLLSNDTTSLAMCVARLSQHLQKDPASYHAIQALSHDLLLVAGVRKEQSQVQQGTAAPNHPKNHNNNNNVAADSRQHVATAVQALWKLIQGDSGPRQQHHQQQGAPSSLFALLYLRLVVLSFSNTPAVQQVMSELMTALADPGGEDEDNSSTTTTTSTLFRTPVSKSLAWCVASNYAGSVGCGTTPQPQPSSLPPPLIPSSWVEVAIRDWNHDSIQVRQAACTFLYNYVIGHGATLDEDEETVVSLVCSSLESLVEETDPTTRLRRLLVGARVVFGVHHQHHHYHTCHHHTGATAATAAASCNEMAKDLVQDLGIVSLLRELVEATTTVTTTGHHYHSDTLECQQLAFELMERLRH